MSFLEVRNLTVCYGDLTIVRQASFALEEGQWLMVVGPNGAGKSTLINAISQGVPYTGDVFFKGENIRFIKAVRLARCMGVLAQNHHVGYRFTVEEVVRLGRYAYAPGIFSKFDESGQADVAAALEVTGLTALANQSVLTLSGGELQRTFLAQLLAQNPQLLLLDEPTNHLDLVYQKQLFAILQKWLKEPGRAILSVMHDLSLARAFGTHALLMRKGDILAAGAAEAVFTRTYLDQAYETDVFSWMKKMLQQWEEEA
jgi:iron complex transport system ATP-binding protein